MRIPHQFVQKLLPARGTARNRERLLHSPNVSSCVAAAATGNTRLYGWWQRRQEDPFQTSCLQSTNSNPTSVTYDILYWLNPSPSFSSVFQVNYYQNIVTLQCTILSLCFPFSLCCLSLHLFYLSFFFPSSISLNISFFGSSPSLFISTFPSFLISFFLYTYLSLVISSSHLIFL